MASENIRTQIISLTHRTTAVRKKIFVLHANGKKLGMHVWTHKMADTSESLFKQQMACGTLKDYNKAASHANTMILRGDLRENNLYIAYTSIMASKTANV